jgi:hypothetical protein
MARGITLVSWLAFFGALGGTFAEGTTAEKFPRKPIAGPPLFFKPKPPVKENGEAARAALRARFPCLVFWCTRKGEMYASFGQRDASKLLGRHMVQRTVKGAGNRASTDAVFVDVSPASFVPAFLKDHVARVWFDDDPKFLHTGPDAKECE